MRAVAAKQLRRAHRHYVALQNKLYNASLELNADPALRLVVDEMRSSLRLIRPLLLVALVRAEESTITTTHHEEPAQGTGRSVAGQLKTP